MQYLLCSCASRADLSLVECRNSSTRLAVAGSGLLSLEVWLASRTDLGCRREISAIGLAGRDGGANYRLPKPAEDGPACGAVPPPNAGSRDWLILARRSRSLILRQSPRLSDASILSSMLCVLKRTIIMTKHIKAPLNYGLELADWSTKGYTTNHRPWG